MTRPTSTGRGNTKLVGGKPTEPACMEQKAQCSICMALPSGWPTPDLPVSALTKRMPAIEQISTQPALDSCLAWATAWEIDGASADSRIAKQAIQAANLRVIDVIPMPVF